MQSNSATALRNKYLIETSELQELIDKKDANLKLVNATWYMPNEGKDPWEEHLKMRITNDTVFFDHDLICDKTIPLPHTMPSLSIFKWRMKKLGIMKDSRIVCYDVPGCFSVARASWMLRYFGAA